MASLFSTIGTGDLGRVRMLIDQGVDIESKDFRGRTVLHKAVQKATPAITALLLEKGSKPNVHDYQGDTPLHMAI
jgi:ankyrin repeat protein